MHIIGVNGTDFNRRNLLHPFLKGSPRKQTKKGNFQQGGSGTPLAETPARARQLRRTARAAARGVAGPPLQFLPYADRRKGVVYMFSGRLRSGRPPISTSILCNPARGSRVRDLTPPRLLSSHTYIFMSQPFRFIIRYKISTLI